MLNHITINSFKLFLAALLLLLTPFSQLNAASIEVSTLSVDSVTTSLLATDTSTGFPVIDTGTSATLIPPAIIEMGTFQNSIFSFSNSFTDGTFSATVYSAGPTAPSASVDTSGGFTNIDLSGLRLSGEIIFNTAPAGSTLTFDTELWPITTTPTSSSYNPANGDFSLSWGINEMIAFDDGFNTLSLSTLADITISGKATVVPVPAAIWLFLSGFIALTGFIKHKK